MLRSTLVCGPPGAGKSTYVDDRREPGDIVVDFDALVEALCPGVGTDRSGIIIRLGMAVKAAAVEHLQKEPHTEGAPHAWIISGAPTRKERDWYANWLGSRVVLIEPGRDVALSQARAKYGEEAAAVVDRWYGGYT